MTRVPPDRGPAPGTQPKCRSGVRRGGNLFKHGKTGTPEHRAWCGMMARCYSSKPGDRNHHLYRGAAISVAEHWHDFENFLADMGPKPSAKHSLDRYPDAAGNYEPGNCRWATAREQANNWVRRNKRFTLGDTTLSESEWARRIGMSREALRDRINAGWPLQRALTEPPRRKRDRDERGRYLNV
jgi:hypothetical protein